MTQLTLLEQFKVKLYKLTNERGKFALEMGANWDTIFDVEAFELMMLDGTVRLIDVSVIMTTEGGAFKLCRIFALSPDAMTERALYKQKGLLHDFASDHQAGSA